MTKIAVLSGSIGLVFGSLLVGASPAKAISFNFSTPATSTSSSAIVYTISGLTLTANNPTGANSPVMQRNANGICAYQTFNNQLTTLAPFCGQDTNASQTLTSFNISFDQDVILKSFTTAATSYQDQTSQQVESGRVQFSPKFTTSNNSFTSPTLTIDVTRITNATFSNANVSGCNNTINQPTCNVSFPNAFRVNAGQLITVSTNNFDTTTQIAPNGSWRLFALEADIAPASVPGPLPLLGAGAAFGMSRRLRQRLKMSAS